MSARALWALTLVAGLGCGPAAGAELDPAVVAALQPYIEGGEINAARLNADLKSAQARAGAAVAPPAPAPAPQPPPPPAPPAAADEKGPSLPPIYLRDSFSDIFLFGRVSSAAKAKGASISYTRDAAGDDTQWSAKGVLFMPITVGRERPGYLGAQVSPYAGLNITKHSDDTKPDKETYLYGVSGEVGYETGALLHYYRLSAGGVRDEVKKQSSFSATAEFIPVIRNDAGNGLCIGVPCGVATNTGLIYAFQPILKAQYDSISGDKVLALSNRGRAFRLGPEFTFNLKPFGPRWGGLTRAHFQATYHVAREFRSDTNVTWLDLALGYNLDAAGHIAVTGGYSRGNDEATGEFTKLYTVALTGKF